MLNTLRRRMAKEEEGFTLIELMVVILIIAILMAIAIPTFLGAQKRAQDRGAQSNLRNALTAAKTIATDNSGTFTTDGTTPIDAAAMKLAEDSLNFIAGGAAVDPAVPNVAVVTDAVAPAGENIVLYNRSASGAYFCIAATSSGKVTYGKGGAHTDVNELTVAKCAADKW